MVPVTLENTPAKTNKNTITDKDKKQEDKDEPLVFSYAQALENSVDYFNGDELAAKVFLDKYALRDKEGRILENDPTMMHWRLAKEFARIEEKYLNPMGEEEIFNLLDNFKYAIPQGSPMSAIGNPYKIQSAGNCFVVESPHDSYGGICYTDQQLVQLMKRRCGCGLELSTIRPAGMIVNNAAGTTDGVPSFMERFSNTCREVAQRGRRGALMETLDCRHPDIREFVTIKQDRKKVTGANVSVKLTDKFMEAAKHDKEFTLQWPVDSDDPVIKKQVKAKEIWDEIIYCAWRKAEPGILFLDNILRSSVAHRYGIINPDFYERSTNPCAEIHMGNDSCRLLAIQLYHFVKNRFTKNAYFDFEHFAEVTIKSQRLMDDVVDIELELMQKIIDKIKSDPEPDEIKDVELKLWQKFKKVCHDGRRTGLGILGLGDTLAALGIKYGSKKSIEVTEEIYKNLCVNAYKSSCILAKERGSFPIFSHEIEKGHPYLSRIFEESPEVYDLYKKYGRRHVALLTTAPTGSVAMLSQTTSGIEPAYLLKYKRRKKINPNDRYTKVDFVDDMGDKWQEFTVYHHGIQEWKDVTGKEDIEESSYFGATSDDVDWVKSVDIQAAAQKWVCHSISKTCNVPRDTPKETISKVYIRAYEKGCKGFTVYRDGCRSGVLVGEDKENSIHYNDAPKRPKELPCEIHHTSVKGEEYFVIVGLLNGDQPYEIFAGKNGQILKRGHVFGHVTKHKRGKYSVSLQNGTTFDDINEYISEDQEALTRTWSMSMRHGIPIPFVVHQLEKTKGEMTSFCKAVGRILKKYIAEGTKIHGEDCPDCGAELIRSEGCVICKSCGFSKCN